MILLDTSGLLAAIDADQRMHASCAGALARARGPLLLSPFVLAELDYLLLTRVGPLAEEALLEEVARGAYRLEPFTAADVELAREVVAKYRSIQLGLTDASLVVLAARHRVHDVLTLDERHFRTIRTLDGRRFRILPGALPAQ